MNLLFLGSGAFGLPTLAALAKSHSIRAIITQPDRPAGRGSTLSPTPIAAFASKVLPQIPLHKPEKVNDLAAQLRDYDADAWVVIAYGQKLGRTLLDGIFAINLHASLLPRWRGAAPINAAMLAGDTRIGNSIITLADRMDAGQILAQSDAPLDPALTAGQLHDFLAANGPAMIKTVLTQHAAQTLHGIAQDESKVTLAPKLSRADGWLDFRESAEACRRRIHGLNPWPGVTVVFQGQPLKFLRAEPVNTAAESEPGGGGVLIDPLNGMVTCGHASALRLLEVQPAGKRPMPWPDFARGQRPHTGDTFIGKES